MRDIKGTRERDKNQDGASCTVKMETMERFDILRVDLSLLPRCNVSFKGVQDSESVKSGGNDHSQVNTGGSVHEM